MNRKQALSLARLAADCYGKPYPIMEIEDSAQPPILVGRSYHWRTPGGDLVHSPNAYRRKFGRPIYHPSSRKIEVGSLWLKACEEFVKDTPHQIVTDRASELVLN